MDTTRSLRPPKARAEVPPPPYRLFAHYKRPGDRPTPYEMNIFRACDQADDPDLWEVEVRYIRRVNP